MALAQKFADALWPYGTYGRMADSMIGGKEGGPKASEGPPPGSPPARTLREKLIAEDPHFEKRMRITMKVIGEEVTRIAKPIESKFRAGLAKSIARRFSSEQLGPIATFFESDAGKAYAAQSMTLFHQRARDAGNDPVDPRGDEGNAGGDGAREESGRASAAPAQAQSGRDAAGREGGRWRR